MPQDQLQGNTEAAALAAANIHASSVCPYNEAVRIGHRDFICSRDGNGSSVQPLRLVTFVGDDVAIVAELRRRDEFVTTRGLEFADEVDDEFLEDVLRQP